MTSDTTSDTRSVDDPLYQPELTPVAKGVRHAIAQWARQAQALKRTGSEAATNQTGEAE